MIIALCKAVCSPGLAQHRLAVLSAGIINSKTLHALNQNVLSVSTVGGASATRWHRLGPYITDCGMKVVAFTGRSIRTGITLLVNLLNTWCKSDTVTVTVQR